MTIPLSIDKKPSSLDNVVFKEYVDKKIVSRLLKSNYLKDDEEIKLKGFKKKITKNGYVNVKYNRKGGIGRTYGFKGLTYQSFRKCLRHTFCYDKYTDIDIKNAHPTMLKQITDCNGIVNTYLTEYVENREKYLEEIIEITKCDRGSAKELFIRILYGGSHKYWLKDLEIDCILPSFVKDLENEMKTISTVIVSSNSSFIKNLPKEKRENKYSIMSYYLQEYEHRILEICYNYLVENKLIKNNVITLCYDGFMVDKIDNVYELCSNLTKVVKDEIGFDLIFVEKVMDMVLKDIIECKEEDFDYTEPQQMYNLILEISNKKNYKKDNSRIFKQSKLSPIVYEPYKDFHEFINNIFDKSSPLYNMFRKNPSNMNTMISYLENYNDEELPFINLNKHIFSFKNGYLDVSDLYNIKFNSFDEIDNSIITSIHYDFDFDTELLNKSYNEIETPIFDRICNYHLEDKELLMIFYGMAGRLHYETNRYDKFNCMTFIKGGANTGKSTTGNILMKNHQNIGTISGKMEGTFGLQSLYKKNIIYNPDMNRNFTLKLDKGDFQRMIEGSHMDIPIKNKGSINNFKWNIPMLFLANYLPDYKDSSGAIPRRLCVFYMDRFLNTRDTSIEKKCIQNEGHLILIKTLKCYIEILKKYEGKTFEDFGVEYFKRGYEEMTNRSNMLYEYLSLPPNEFSSWVSHEKNSVVQMKTFKRVVEKYFYMNGNKQKFELDRTTLGRFGYVIKTIQICASCNQKAKGRGDRCCGNYNKNNRRKRQCILNMKIHYEQDLEIED